MKFLGATALQCDGESGANGLLMLPRQEPTWTNLR